MHEIQTTPGSHIIGPGLLAILITVCAAVPSLAQERPTSRPDFEIEQLRAALRSEFTVDRDPSGGLARAAHTVTASDHPAVAATTRIVPFASGPDYIGNTQQIAQFKEVTVRCDNGKSINKALKNKAVELVINIEGICTEDVVIARDYVTLRGTDASLDGIRATAQSTDPRQSALKIRSARRIQIENLSFGGSSWDGIRLHNSTDGINMVNVVLEDNLRRGMTLFSSIVVMDDSTIINNGNDEGGGRGGVYAFGPSIFDCNTCTITNNPTLDSGIGVIAGNSAFVSLDDSAINGRVGAFSELGATVAMLDSTVESRFALVAQDRGTISVRTTPVGGTIFADGDSTVQLSGSAQTANAVGNFVSSDSNLRLFGAIDEANNLVTSALVGTTFISDFSTAHLSPGSSAENLQCSQKADALCGSTGIGTSTCPSCFASPSP